MKKVLLLALVAIFAAACVEEGTVQMRSENVRIYERDWLYYGDDPMGPYFEAVWHTDYISRQAYESGMVDVYMYLEGGEQVPLPYTRHYQNSANGYKWTTTVDYAFDQGRIFFYFTESDFPANPSNPGIHEFRIVVSDRSRSDR